MKTKNPAAKNRQQCIVLAFAIALAVGGGVRTSSAQLTMPATVSAGDVDWFLSNNTGAFGAEPGGLGVTDGEFTNPLRGLDAYDAAWLLRVNGNYFASPGAVTFNNRLALSGTTTINSVDVQVQYWLPTDQRMVRAAYFFHNGTGSQKSLSIRIESNLGSDTDTTVAERQAPGVNTRWLVTTDNQVGGDLVNTLARYGTGAPVTPTGSSFVPGMSISNRIDILADVYQLDIPANTTWRIVEFGRLDSIETSVAAGVASAFNFATNKFDDTSLMASLGLFAGIPGTTDEIKNWVVPVPEPGPTTLCVTALIVMGGFRFLARSKTAGSL